MIISLLIFSKSAYTIITLDLPQVDYGRRREDKSERGSARRASNQYEPETGFEKGYHGLSLH